MCAETGESHSLGQGSSGSCISTSSAGERLSAGAAAPVWATALQPSRRASLASWSSPDRLPGFDTASRDADRSASLHSTFCPISLDPQERKGRGELF